MTSRPWMPMYWGDYLADTGHLRTIEHGAYLLLIGHYWTNGGLPNDDYRLASIARMRVEDWRRMRPAIEPFFTPGWRHTRIDAELSRSAEISSKRKAAALQKHSKSSANAHHLHTHPQPQPHKKDIEGNSGRKKPARPLPDDWVPSNSSVQKAQALGFTPREIGREGEKFKYHAREKDRRAVLWDAAFDKWMINAAGYQNKSPPQKPNEGGFAAFPNTPEFHAWRSYYRDSGKGALVRELEKRSLEGRAFNFDSQWPPGFKATA